MPRIKKIYSQNINKRLLENAAKSIEYIFSPNEVCSQSVPVVFYWGAWGAIYEFMHQESCHECPMASLCTLLSDRFVYQPSATKLLAHAQENGKE